jgi:hypothetical protein
VTQRPAEPCSGCARGAHAERKVERAVELLRVWASGRDAVLAKASAKLVRQLQETP